MAALPCGCSPRDDRASRSPNVFVIVVDAASAAHFGCYGDRSGTSPNIDALARESVLFENSYSQAPSTLLTTVSLLTSVRPTTHQMHEGIQVPKEFHVLPQILRDKGFATYGIIGNPFAGAPELGLDRGYDEAVQVYRLDHVVARSATEESKSFAVAQPSDINVEIFKRIPAWKKTGMYVYIHYLQPHKPYDPPERFVRDFNCGPASWKSLHDRWVGAMIQGRATEQTIRSLEERYRANIKYVDEAIGELIAKLKSAGLYDDALIILTSDHGEAFFKHKKFGHNLDLYDDMVRVPLIIKFPASDKVKPARRTNLTETVDLMPTILEYLGIAVPDQAEGESLLNLAYMKKDRLDGEEVILRAFAFTPSSSIKSNNKHAIRVRDYKYILDVDAGEELYNLVDDPDEQHNLAEREPKKTADFRALLNSRIDTRSGTTIVHDSNLRKDPRMTALLNTLGYSATGYSGSDSDDHEDSQDLPTTQPSDPSVETPAERVEGGKPE